jgi:hypothetical protein
VSSPASPTTKLLHGDIETVVSNAALIRALNGPLHDERGYSIENQADGIVNARDYDMVIAIFCRISIGSGESSPPASRSPHSCAADVAVVG